MIKFTDKSVMNGRFLVYDLEMTGLNPDRDEIVEMACVPVDGTTINEEMGFFVQVNPNSGFDPSATNVTGLSHNSTSFDENPDIETALPEFLAQAQTRVLVGQNPRLDMEFLRNAGKNSAIMIPSFPVIDISRLFIRLFPGEHRYNLDHIARKLNLGPKRHEHNAWNDTVLTAQAFVRLVAIFRKNGNVTMGDLIKAGRMR